MPGSVLGLSRHAADVQIHDPACHRAGRHDLAASSYVRPIQHLGNVYEGLLELQPHFATEDMLVIRKAADDEERVIPNRQAIPRGFVAADITYKKGSVGETFFGRRVR